MGLVGVLVLACCIYALQGKDLKISSTDGNFQLYINEYLLPPGDNHAVVCLADTYHLVAGYDLIAVKAQNRGSDNGIIASVGDTFVTDEVQWKCSYIPEDGWMTFGFKDTQWPPATGRNMGCIPPGISSAAKWIWTQQAYTVVYCRARISTKRLTITADSSYLLFFDGVSIDNLPNASNRDATDTVGVPALTKVVAVQATSLHTTSGIIASLADASFFTDSTWKCTTTQLSGWMNVTFDDKNWPRAAVTSSSWVTGITSLAKWIWTPYAARTVYCRSKITCNHTFEILEHTVNINSKVGESVQLSVHTLDDCRAACVNDPLCLGFQISNNLSLFNIPGCAPLHSFVLKPFYPTTFYMLADCQPDCSADTWTKLAQTYVKGGIARNTVDLSLQGCKDMCSTQPTCSGITYMDKSTRSCELVFNKLADRQTNSSVDSYMIRRCEASIDGNWGSWSAPTDCMPPTTKKCVFSHGIGNIYKTRTCDNPAPNSIGRPCDGSALYTTTCLLPWYCRAKGTK